MEPYSAGDIEVTSQYSKSRVDRRDLHRLRIDVSPPGPEPEDLASVVPPPAQSGKFVLLEDLLPIEHAEAIAKFVKRERDWKLREEWFFSQHEVKWIAHTLNAHFGFERLPLFDRLRAVGAELVESHFSAVIGSHFKINGHMLEPGQVIAIHNDSPNEMHSMAERYRLLFYIDNDFCDEDGGHLLIYDQGGRRLIEAIRPTLNTALLLALSDFSFHAVSRVRRRRRYSVVLSYWGYPLLVRDEKERRLVDRAIRLLLEVGGEQIQYRGTSLAYYHYNIYEKLVGWGAPVDLCVAALLAATPNLPISLDNVKAVLSPGALSTFLRVKSGNDPLLIAANLMEAAQDDRQLESARQQLRGMAGLDPEVMRKIQEG